MKFCTTLLDGMEPKSTNLFAKLRVQVKPATDDSREVLEMRKACETQHVVLFVLLHETDFSCLVVEAVIMHETKRFSPAIRDKIELYERIIKSQYFYSHFSRYLARAFFSCKFLMSCMFSCLADFLRIICSQLNNQMAQSLV